MFRRTMAVGIVGGALLFGAAFAQPRAGRVLERVSVAPVAGGTELTVRFPFPVEVRNFFPDEATELFAVRVEPLAIEGEERQSASRREIRAPQGSNRGPVVEVIYDGEIFGGPYLLVVFERPAAACARPTEDARGVVISVREEREAPGSARHGGR